MTSWLPNAAADNGPVATAVTALPGAPDMRMHKDHPALFQSKELDQPLPTFAVTMLLPLLGLNAVSMPRWGQPVWLNEAIAEVPTNQRKWSIKILWDRKDRVC